MARTGALLVALLLAAGCGQKGPLFLPEDNDAAAVATDAEPATDAAEEREDERE